MSTPRHAVPAQPPLEYESTTNALSRGFPTRIFRHLFTASSHSNRSKEQLNILRNPSIPRQCPTPRAMSAKPTQGTLSTPTPRMVQKRRRAAAQQVSYHAQHSRRSRHDVDVLLLLRRADISTLDTAFRQQRLKAWQYVLSSIPPRTLAPNGCAMFAIPPRRNSLIYFPSQTNFDTEDGSATFFCHRHHFCSHRRPPPLRQLSGTDAPDQLQSPSLNINLANRGFLNRSKR